MFDRLESKANERRLVKESAEQSGRLHEATTDDEFVDAFDRI